MEALPENGFELYSPGIGRPVRIQPRCRRLFNATDVVPAFAGRSAAADRSVSGQRPDWSGRTRDERAWRSIGAAKRRIGSGRWAALGQDAHATIPFVSGPHPGRRLSCHTALLIVRGEPFVPFPPLAA